jgi:hypothetical protein
VRPELIVAGAFAEAPEPEDDGLFETVLLLAEARAEPKPGEEKRAAEFAIDGNVLKDVAILGPVSRNGEGGERYHFPEALMAREAAKYGGVRVYVDHDLETVRGKKVRDTEDLVGVTENARWDATTKRIRADIRLGKTDRALRVLSIASEFPGFIGVSPFHHLTLDRGTGAVQAVRKVRSVDIVTEPATTGSLAESIKADGEEKMDPKTLAELKANFPGLVQELAAETIAQFRTSEEGKALKAAAEAATKERDAARAETETLRKKVAAAESRGVAQTALDKSGLPKASRDRILSACAGMVVTAESIGAAILGEKTYLDALRKETGGRSAVRGAGPGAGTGTEEGEWPESAVAADAIVRRVVFGEKAAEDEDAEAESATASGSRTGARKGKE